MNAKLLFAATVVVSAIASLASTAALAAETTGPLTRDHVTAEFELARANGTLQTTDYDYAAATRSTGSTLTRSQVAASVGAKPSPLLANSSVRSRTYNPFGTELLQPASVTRAQVKAETREAVANGTLPRTDYEYEQDVVARRSHEHAAAKPILARLFRSNATGS